MWIHPPLKIVPNKFTTSSCWFTESWTLYFKFSLFVFFKEAAGLGLTAAHRLRKSEGFVGFSCGIC